MKWIFVTVLAGLLAGCAAIEEENASDTPIPPPRPGPFEGIGSSGPPPSQGGSAPLGF